MKIKRQILFMVVFLLGLLWGLNGQFQGRHWKARYEAEATRRLIAFANCLVLACGERHGLPEAEDDLWEFVAGDSPSRACLSSFCRGPLGAFKYQRVSTNSFTLSFEGFHGLVEMDYDGTNLVYVPAKRK